jgi:hypothetical protein
MAKYINTAMAIEALEKGLNVWVWAPSNKRWDISGLSSLTQKDCGHRHFAIGEKPTSPPRKMIEIDGVVMPAPIFGRDEAGPDLRVFVLRFGLVACCSALSDVAVESYAYGDVFATNADAIAARDARKLIIERAMERAK